jgi:hypothetical protein
MYTKANFVSTLSGLLEDDHQPVSTLSRIREDTQQVEVLVLVSSVDLPLLALLHPLQHLDELFST